MGLTIILTLNIFVLETFELWVSLVLLKPVALFCSFDVHCTSFVARLLPK